MVGNESGYGWSGAYVGNPLPRCRSGIADAHRMPLFPESSGRMSERGQGCDEGWVEAAAASTVCRQSAAMGSGRRQTGRMAGIGADMRALSATGRVCSPGSRLDRRGLFAEKYDLGGRGLRFGGAVRSGSGCVPQQPAVVAGARGRGPDQPEMGARGGGVPGHRAAQRYRAAAGATPAPNHRASRIAAGRSGGGKGLVTVVREYCPGRR